MQVVANARVPVLPVVHLAQVVGAAAMLVVVGVVAGAVVMLLLRWRGWAWSCGVPLLAAAPLAVVLGWRGAVCYDAAALSTVGGGLWRHLVDLRAGGDLADRARDRIGPLTPYRRWRGWRRLRAGEWLTDEGVAIGFSRKGELVRVPIACGRAVMAIVVGATGSGKTILMLLLAIAAIKSGSGVIFIDPKGDDYVLEQLRQAAGRHRRRFLSWEPLGDVVYNPYDRGSDTEIADKLLAAEVFTEPHYQRLAQRYLGHVIRTLRLADVDISLATVVEHMHPGHLAGLTSRMSPTHAGPLLAYLETLGPQQERDLAGARDRLAILAESDIGPALDPSSDGVQIDLRDSLDHGDVVLFRLEADRRPLAAAMVGASIIQDLVALSDERQHGEQRPGLVIIDEYSAVGAPGVGRLFGRGRGGCLSQVLGTQDLGDLGAIESDAMALGGSILSRTGSNIEVLLAGRQTMPESAEMIAAIAGTRGVWITTQQTHAPVAGLLTGLGSRSRGREYKVHPDRIKSLRVGEVVVTEPPKGRTVIVRVFHPDLLRRRGVQC